MGTMARQGEREAPRAMAAVPVGSPVQERSRRDRGRSATEDRGDDAHLAREAPSRGPSVRWSRPHPAIAPSRVSRGHGAPMAGEAGRSGPGRPGCPGPWRPRHPAGTRQPAPEVADAGHGRGEGCGAAATGADAPTPAVDQPAADDRPRPRPRPRPGPLAEPARRHVAKARSPRCPRASLPRCWCCYGAAQTCAALAVTALSPSTDRRRGADCGRGRNVAGEPERSLGTPSLDEADRLGGSHVRT